MKKELSLPFDLGLANKVAGQFGTPIYIYNEVGIRETAEGLNKAFSWAKDYKNFFAVKATPTPAILKILHEEGMGFDCSTRSELVIMQKLGIEGKDIFYTSNNTPKEYFELAVELGATVNIDDLAQVPVFIEALAGKHMPRVAARYNPGDLKTGNTIIGHPTEAKYGMNLKSLKETFNLLKTQKIDQFGLHTMVASNELKPEYFAETTQVLLDAIAAIEKDCGIKVSFINIGGGFGLNYKPDQEPIDVVKTSAMIKIVMGSRPDLQLFTENGRYVTGGHGYLLTKVRYVMNKYKTYLGVDASMHNLMRPGMYGAYHHITVLGRNQDPIEKTYDVVGSLCENNDKFAIDRKLPDVKAGDLLVIHDAGAHGHAMGFNYNGLLRSAELLLTKSGELKLIRQAETTDDYLRNVVWPN